MLNSADDVPLDRSIFTRGEVRAPETGLDRPVEMRCEGRRNRVDTTNGISYPSADSLASAFCRVIRAAANTATEAGGSANLRKQLFSFLIEPLDPSDVRIGLGFVDFDTELIEPASVRTKCVEIGQLVTA